MQATITCTTPDAQIRYAMGGGAPDETSTLYADPFAVVDGDIIKARGYKDGMEPSEVAVFSVGNETFAQPTLSLSRSGSTVSGTIGNTVEGAQYRYRTGSAPQSATDGTAISGTSFSFTSSAAVTVYVVGFKSGYLPTTPVSKSVSAYTPKCATPSISQSGNTVTFTCSTSGATIHYSGCGRSGTCTSGGSVSITQSGTMTAYATKSGYTASSTASRSCTYTDPTPQLPSVSISNISTDTSDGSRYVTITAIFGKALPVTCSYSVSIKGTYRSTGRSYSLSPSGTVYLNATNKTTKHSLGLSSGEYIDNVTITYTISASGYRSSSATATRSSL